MGNVIQVSVDSSVESSNRGGLPPRPSLSENPLSSTESTAHTDSCRMSSDGTLPGHQNNHRASFDFHWPTTALSFSDIRIPGFVTRTNDELDEIMDVEIVHWNKFIARVLCIFLLVCMVIFFSLETVSRLYLVIGVVVGSALVLLLIGTFIDLSFLYSWICKLRLRGNNPPPAQDDPIRRFQQSPIHTPS